MPIGQETMVEDGVNPAAHVALGPAQVPARERALENVLDEIIGVLCIRAQQLPGKAPQPGDMRFDLGRRVVWHCLSPANSAAGPRHRNGLRAGYRRHRPLGRGSLLSLPVPPPLPSVQAHSDGSPI
jgi:hypothetical protein